MANASKPDPLSPCIGVCHLSPRTQLCEGCFRTIEEIAAWSGYTAEAKRRVLAQIEVRCEGILDDLICQ